MVSGEELEEMPFGEIDDEYGRDRVSNTSDVYGEESDEMLEGHSDEGEFDEHGIMIDRSQLSSNKSKKKDSESAGTRTTKKDSSTEGVARMIDRTLNTTAEYDEAVIPAVWVDPDEDEDFDARKDKVSLVATQRLKKFRTSLDQKAINTQDYVRQLRSHHEYSTSVPTSWAKLEPRHTQTRKSNDDDEIDQAMSTSAYQLLSSSATPLTLLGMGGISSSTAALPAQSIRLERQPDANLMEPNNAAVQAVKFHPQQSNILFTAGLDKTLRFFQIDGKTNPKVHGIYCKFTPVSAYSLTQSKRWTDALCTDSYVIIFILFFYVLFFFLRNIQKFPTCQ
jgi:U3 small nucleolar RNA-associated protein 18